MTRKPEESEEYQRFVEFSKTAEYKQLTEGDKAVVNDFNAESEEHMQKLRDYIYADSKVIPQEDDVKNYSSLRLTKMQIGTALKKRDEFQAAVKQNVSSDRIHHTTQARVYSYRRLGMVPYNGSHSVFGRR